MPQREEKEIVDTDILEAIFDQENRANPYPFFAKLRKYGVSWQTGGMSQTGSYVVGTYKDVVALLHDTRLSSDMRKSKDKLISQDLMFRSFIALDPPEHDRLRKMAMKHFGPPDRPDYIEELRPKIELITRELIDSLNGQKQFDLVKCIAGPLPILMIAAILGVPEKDRPQFKTWSDDFIEFASIKTDEAQKKSQDARDSLIAYMASLVILRRQNPDDSLISRMALDIGADGSLELPDLVATATLLLIAGHETTINLIANGMLTLLRHPDILAQIRKTPGLAVGTVEEILRYEPPVQLLARRTALDDITIDEVTIPKGSLVTLALAAANRDDARFKNPNQFDPKRVDNAHLGFGSGIHYCFGAPLARVEGEIALRELTRRLKNPRLTVDPPPYRTSPVLRGPRELLIDIDGVVK